MNLSSNYSRFKTRVVWVGQIPVGGNYPIRVQSMVTADTKNTQAVMKEVRELVDVGCEIIRLTVPTKADCDNLASIRNAMKAEGIKVPLVADIHFTPSVALECVEWVDKIRVNPGNFVDKKLFKVREYSDEQYEAEIQKIREKFTPLVLKCKEYGRAMRIGTNHGSLSDRILNRFGDTPEGMVESALEFARICIEHDFHNFIFSMKASNVQVMIEAYRFLVQKMISLNMNYPIHLGVTEAGEGEDGRVKSAIGIGALLEEGIGDTIRVSLTEDPKYEVPVAYQLVEKYNSLFCQQGESKNIDQNFKQEIHFSGYHRRLTRAFSLGNSSLGGINPVRVWTSLIPDEMNDFFDYQKSIISEDMPIEGIEIKSSNYEEFKSLGLWNHDLNLGVVISEISDLESINDPIQKLIYLNHDKFLSESEFKKLINFSQERDCGLEICYAGHLLYSQNFREHFKNMTDHAEKLDFDYLLFSLQSQSIIRDYLFFRDILEEYQLNYPIHLRFKSDQKSNFLIRASVDLGTLLVDGLGDSLQISSGISLSHRVALSYNILQATRLRITKAEYISCPSCGRTLFDLQTTTDKIREATHHLKGVKIGVMGCIVNGPGEMADADFGYVGTGEKKISLYVGQECVIRNIAEENAVDELVKLIKEHGRWIEPIQQKIHA